MADIPHPIQRTDEAAAVGEWFKHLLEIKEMTSESKALKLIRKCLVIHELEPAALWVVARLLSGDLSEITRSKSDIGKERSRTKQAVQQEEERVLIALRAHYPECANAIIQLRQIHAKLSPVTESPTQKESNL